MMCESTYPDTEFKEVREFAQRANMFRHNWRVQDLNRLFVATNFEEVKSVYNDDTALIRFEFIELMVRIAKDKYLDR